MTHGQIEALLIQTVEAVALLCDETSELVDKYHRPGASDIGLVAIRDRSLALSGVAASLRQALPTTQSTLESVLNPGSFQTRIAK